MSELIYVTKDIFEKALNEIGYSGFGCEFAARYNFPKSKTTYAIKTGGRYLLGEEIAKRYAMIEDKGMEIL